MLQQPRNAEKPKIPVP